MTNKPFKDVFLELLALSCSENNTWRFQKYYNLDLYIFNVERSEYNGLIITYHENMIIVTHDFKTYEITTDDISYELGVEVYKSARTLYNIENDLEIWNTPYNYDSGAIDRECRNVFKDFYY